MDPVVVRMERPADREAIRAVHDAAFGQPDEGRIVDAVRSEPWFEPELSLVAEVVGEVVGHCLISACAVEDPEGGRIGLVAALGPIAVVPERQRQGIGGLLVTAVIESQRLRGATAVVLLGHPGYYPRFGFGPARALGLDAPAPWPDDAWLARPLVDAALIPRGVVRYPPAFAVHP